MHPRPKEWTAQQCAAYRGFSRHQWLEDVASGMEPQPSAELAGMPLWNAAEVRNWKRPGEWFADECAAYHGISRAQWLSLVHRGLAPAAVRRIRDRRVWNLNEARAVELKTPNSGTPRPRNEWTATECAAYMSVSAPTWRAAVLRGDAPQPVRTQGNRKYWDANQVMSAGPLKASRPDQMQALKRRTEWTAAECAAYLGISTHAWRVAVHRGQAPQPIRSQGTSKHWDPDQVMAMESTTEEE